MEIHDLWHPDANSFRPCFPKEQAQILTEKSKVSAGIRPVSLRIHILRVHQEKVRPMHDIPEIFLRHMKRSLKIKRPPGVLVFLHEGSVKGGVKKRLTTAEHHATACRLKIEIINLQFFVQLFRAVFLPLLRLPVPGRGIKTQFAPKGTSHGCHQTCHPLAIRLNPDSGDGVNRKFQSAHLPPSSEFEISSSGSAIETSPSSSTGSGACVSPPAISSSESQVSPPA